jgi:hypothetical protein
MPVDVVSAASNLFAVGASTIISTISDLSNREIAVPTESDVNTAFGPLSSITLFAPAGPFFVGDSVSDEESDLFRVVDGATDQEIFNPTTNAYVQVTAISPSVVGSGFYSGAVDLTLSTPIPDGRFFKVFYGRRGTLGEVPPDLASFPMIRRSNDRVRFPENIRTGTAPTSIAQPLNIATSGYPDPHMAQWKAVLRGTVISGLPIPQYGGSSGFVNIGRKKNVNDADDEGVQGHQAAGFLSIYEKNLVGTGTIGGANPLVRINGANNATVITATTVELAVGDFFRTTTASAIRPGIDMLEVTRSTGVKEVYVITAFDATNVRRATLKTPSGGNAALNPSETIQCRWVRPNFFTGGDNDPVAVSSPERFHFRGFASLIPGPITDDSTIEVAQEAPFFGAARNTRTGGDAARGYWDVIALRWGGFNITDPTVSEIGRRDVKGELWGDGSIESYGGRIRGMIAKRSNTRNVTTTETYTWDPAANAMQVFVASSASIIVETVALAGTYSPLDGDQITFFLDYTTTGINTSFVFPASFKFSGSDGTTPLVLGTKAKFEGVFYNGNFYFTRTDFI